MFQDDPKLKEKQEKLKEIAAKFRLRGKKTLSREQKARETELMDRMEFQLNSLILESKIKEADIRINTLEEVLKI